LVPGCHEGMISTDDTTVKGSVVRMTGAPNGWRVSCNRVRREAAVRRGSCPAGRSGSWR
jgi:hypothetical protein